MALPKTSPATYLTDAMRVYLRNKLEEVGVQPGQLLWMVTPSVSDKTDKFHIKCTKCSGYKQYDVGDLTVYNEFTFSIDKLSDIVVDFAKNHIHEQPKAKVIEFKPKLLIEVQGKSKPTGRRFRED